MASSSDEWTSNSTEVAEVAIIQPGAERPKIVHHFQPQFTYPIFGEEESIFGYQGLGIKFRFTAHDLESNVNISYDKKFPTVGTTVANNLHKPLKECLPGSKSLIHTSNRKPLTDRTPGAFTKLADYEKSVQNDAAAKDFTPPGKLAKSYTLKGRHYEIWSAPLSDPGAQRILDNMQIFILFFIEGGTQIKTEDVPWTIERWTVYFVYEKLSSTPTPNASSYSLIGYATTYRFYAFDLTASNAKNPQTITTYPPPEPISISSLPSRMRISQFLILPPYQYAGHGANLYTTIYNHTLADATIRELTVEDPNEAFDVLRDTQDYLLLHPFFLESSITINPNPYAPSSRRPRRLPTSSLLPMPTIQSFRTKYKIAPRQFARVLEMHLLSRIPLRHRTAGGASQAKLLIQKSKAPDENDRRYYWWRMIVKQRVYKQNKDTLIQIDQPDRIEKLNESVTSVEEEYEQLLGQFEAQMEKLRLREEEGEGTGKNGDMKGSTTGNRAKRKVIVEEDDDEDDRDVDSGPEAKKVRA